jgi:hypothetical protein
MSVTLKDKKKQRNPFENWAPQTYLHSDIYNHFLNMNYSLICEQLYLVHNEDSDQQRKQITARYYTFENSWATINHRL